mmetsp:Transcript_30322/g.93858  ORF Transcript_30322/g.93858 Transcript_30322/m.93858 type:complete len:80 (+) Transcript_30322:287-526(+)
MRPRPRRGLQRCGGASARQGGWIPMLFLDREFRGRQPESAESSRVVAGRPWNESRRSLGPSTQRFHATPQGECGYQKIV